MHHISKVKDFIVQIIKKMRTLRDINIRAFCAECGTPLWGKHLHKRGDLYYCTADFQRLSPEEKIEVDRQRRNYEDYKKMFDGTGT